MAKKTKNIDEVKTEETTSLGENTEVTTSPVSEENSIDEKSSEITFSDAELIQKDRSAPVASIKGPVKHQDKDFIFLDGSWRWVPNSEAWEFLKANNINASEKKNYVDASQITPVGPELKL